MSSFVSGSVNSPKNNYLSLQDLEQNDRFIHRHIGPSTNEITQMLAVLGMSSLDELIDKVVPDSIRMSGELELPESRTETDVLNQLRGIYQDEIHILLLNAVMIMALLATSFYAFKMFFILRVICIGCIRVHLANLMMSTALLYYNFH